ncbi:MAG: MFS transporter [Candidatus Nanosalina sp.]
MIGREIDEIYVYELLKNFALTLVGVFIPIYIISQGFSLFHAALFIVISGFIGIVLSYPVSRVISRIGFKHGLAAAYLFILPGLVLIQSLELSLAVIVVSSVLYNTGRVLHNICLNSEFAVDSDEDSRGSDSGKMLSLPSVSRVISPVIGGFIFASAGFQTLLLVAIAFLALSVVPLLASSDHRDPMDYSFRDILAQEHFTAVPLFVIRGVQAVTAVSVFSLFIFMIVGGGGAVDVGWARSLDSLGFVLTGLATGKLVERYGKRPAIILGTSGAALIHLLRSIVALPLHAFLVSFLGGIFFQIYHVPIYSVFADRAEDEDVLEFYALRKIFVSVGNVLTVATLVGSYLFLDLRGAFTATFLPAAASTVAMAYLSRNL